MEPVEVIYIVFEVVIISTLLIGLLIGIVIYFRQKRNQFYRENERMKHEFERQMLKTQIEVQEATFSQLSKELHDNIGQLLNSARWLISMDKQEAQRAPKLQSMLEETLLKASDELKTLSRSLDKDWLSKFNLAENLKAEIDRINVSSTITTTLDISVQVMLSPDEQIMLFRIIQEALQNAIKHARPTFIAIQIKEAAAKLVIIIEDDGIGYDATLQKEGIGLQSMRHRATLLGGSINWHSNNGTGCRIEIALPQKSTT